MSREGGPLYSTSQALMNGVNGLSRFQERAVVASTVLDGRVKNYLHGLNGQWCCTE